MRIVKSNLSVLAAQKGQREGRRITLRTVADETGISRYTIYAFADNSIKQYPKDVIERLCTYFVCSVGDLLLVEDIETQGDTSITG